MPTTTWQIARREFGEYLGYSHLIGKDGSPTGMAWSTTTDVATSALVISAELRDAGFDDLNGGGSGDDEIERLWALLLGANNAGKERQVKTYDASAGEITVTGTNLVAESGSTDFELHRYKPSSLRNWLNVAGRKAFPLLHVPLSRYLFTVTGQVRYDIPAAIVGEPTAIYLDPGIPTSYANNILSNPSFEDFTAGAPDNWTATTLDTAEESSTTTPKNYAVAEDGSAVRLTSQAGSTGTLLQTISSPGTHSGQRIVLSIWVYCLTPSIVSTQITINGTINLGANVDGGLHRGTGWELLTHFEDAPVTISTLTVGLSVLSTATDNTEFYADKAICVVGPSQVPEQVRTKLFNWEYKPTVMDSTLRQYVTFPYEFPDNYLLRIEGMGYLNTLAAETDVIEIGDPQTQLLYAFASRELFRRFGQMTPDSDGKLENRQLRLAEQNIDEAMVHAMRIPRPQMRIPDW